MKVSKRIIEKIRKYLSENKDGFTVVEVIVAGTIMIILCVGTLTVFSYVVKINRGENLRAQALSVLQQEVEFYRSLKFVPIGTDNRLYAGNYTRSPIASADGRTFNINVTITNIGFNPISNTDEASCVFKEISINATPVIVETGWLANLKTNVTIQRVRSN